MKRYSILLSGDLLPGAERAEAVATLEEQLKVPRAKAEALLGGRARRVKGIKSLERAERIRTCLQRVGVDCSLREDEPDPVVQIALEPAFERESESAAESAFVPGLEPSAPPSAAELFARPSAMRLEAADISCPKCNDVQPPADHCRRCGIVFDKYRAATQQERRPQHPVTTLSMRDAFPYRLLNRVLMAVFLASLGLTLWSGWKKNQFPDPRFYDIGRLAEPRQSPTGRAPFEIEAEQVRYRIEPLFDYELDGVVVSLHDTDVFWDIYHAQDWKDFINIRDICVVWGENVTSGVFREMDYHNTTWTCWISTDNQRTADRFGWTQLSNNHLLTHNPVVHDAIKSAEIGDQIRLRGQLASYAHAGGFKRGTSTVRTDTGNGACETVWVEDLQIIRKSNSGWRLINRLAFGMTLIGLLGLTYLFFFAPLRAPR